MIIFPALAVAAIVFVFIMFAYHAGVEDIEKMGRNYKETREMKKVALIIIGLWLLLAGGVWATEKDCSQEVKIEVGGRYLIEIERTYNANVLYVYSTPQSYVTDIQIKEISNSGKYARVSQMNEEKPYWAKIKDLKIIERLPEGGWKASSVELGSNTLELELKPTPGPWRDMKGR